MFYRFGRYGYYAASISVRPLNNERSVRAGRTVKCGSLDAFHRSRATSLRGDGIEFNIYSRIRVNFDAQVSLRELRIVMHSLCMYYVSGVRLLSIVIACCENVELLAEISRFISIFVF